MPNTIFFSGESLGVISDQELAGFMMFCEKQGIDTEWNQDKQRLELSPSLRKHTVFISSKDKIADDYSREIAAKLNLSLAGHGLSTSNEDPDRSEYDLLISIGTMPTGTADTHLVIEHRPELDIKLKNLLYKELRNRAISVSFTRIKAKTSFRPLLTVSSTTAAALVNNFETTAALGLSRAIIRYFSEKQHTAAAAFLPLEKKKNLIRDMVSQTTGKSASTQKVTAQKTAVPKNTEHHKGEATLHEQKIQAEAYFDYTIYPPEHGTEDPEFIITGHFNIKNTGNTTLNNPILCIRIDPISGAGLSGQIVPPNMTDTLSIQGPTGKKGWKYVYEDWMERIKTKGEYWITPIQPVQIKPGETESLSNFQVILHPLDNNKHTTIDGFVYFNDGKDRFIANNRIQFSF